MNAWLLLGVTLLLPSAEWWKEEQEAATGSSLIETVRGRDGASRLDWESGTLEAVGIATCDPAVALSPADCYRRALRAARVIAQQKLAETLHGVAVDGYATLANELIQSSSLKTATRGLVTGARVVEEAKEQMEDGSLVARVVLRLDLYPSAEGSTSVVGALMPGLVASSIEQPATMEAGEVVDVPGPVTGLILDATAVEARPALSPSVKEEQGRTVYGRSVADSAFTGRLGLVAYTSSVERARRLEHRVGESPLVVSVIRADGPNRADLVVRSDDAAMLVAADRQGGFLARCAVAVVLD